MATVREVVGRAVQGGLGALGLVFAASAAGGAADPPAANPASGGWEQLLDNRYTKVSLDVRTRMELANFESFPDHSSAFTTRVLAGIGSKPLHGLSAYAELESSFAYDNSAYFDVVDLPNREGQTPIADPPETDLNQAFLQYENPELLELHARVGRQRILLDDVRFIGNVVWRQNEQTYDAVFGSTSLGIPDLRASYGWVRDVHRVFGNDGPAATRDWDSDSHLVNVAYTGFAPLAVTAFAYLLDFRSDAPGFSSNSYGVRVHGARDLPRRWELGYAASYAFQVDAGRNPVDYEAEYVMAEGSVGYAPAGTFGTGYELLGSDAGRARFVTPLATAHKWNGFADVFVNNGGTDGLQDLYAFFAPALPWRLSGRVVYHHFWSDEDGTALGEEYDFVLTRPFGEHLSVLTKGALFESKTRALADGWRYWLEFTFTY